MPFYPGAGAGGHCIPKDPRFLLKAAENSKMKNGFYFSHVSVHLKI